MGESDADERGPGVRGVMVAAAAVAAAGEVLRGLKWNEGLPVP